MTTAVTTAVAAFSPRAQEERDISVPLHGHPAHTTGHDPTHTHSGLFILALRAAAARLGRVHYACAGVQSPRAHFRTMQNTSIAPTPRGYRRCRRVAAGSFAPDARETMSRVRPPSFRGPLGKRIKCRSPRLRNGFTSDGARPHYPRHGACQVDTGAAQIPTAAGAAASISTKGKAVLRCV